MSGRLPSDAMSYGPLPEPESEQLAALLGEGTARLVYGLLYRRRSNPPTAAEIGFFLDAAASARMPADRVLRSLRTHFDIAPVVRDGGERYELRGWAPHHRETGRPALSLRRRAQALAPGFCAQCGKSPAKHGVVLEVDLRVPPEWGGTTDPENLWPLNYRGFLNADNKDRLENYLHDAVCSGRMPLQAAQEAITTDWVKAYCAARLGECPAGLR